MSATTKTILKLTHTEAVVKITGTGTVAITLATDLKMPDEVYTALGSSVEIRKIYISQPPTQEVIVNRNSVAVLQLFGNVDWNLEDIKISDLSASDLSVVTAGDGTVILTLRKSHGYDYPFRSEALTTGT